MASVRSVVRTDGSVVWQIRWREVGTGKQKAITGPDRGEAERYALILTQCGHDLARADAIHAAVTSPRGAGPTLDDAAALHIEGLRTHANEQGRIAYRNIYNLHIKDDLGRLPVDQITPDMVRRWLYEVELAEPRELEDGSTTRVPTDKSCKNWHGLLSGIFKTAIREGWAPSNPCPQVPLPRRTEHELQEPIFLSRADYRILLGEMVPRFQPFLELLVGTGMRFGEATALTIGDLRLTADVPVISVTKAICLKQGNQYVGPPKTKKGRRTISISTHLAEVLEPLCAGRAKRDRLIEPINLRTENLALRHNGFSEDYWHPARARAMDVEKHGPQALARAPRIHDLRHSHASWLIEQGVDLATVSRRLGHESIQTTVNTYGHLSGAQQQRAADAIARALGD